MEQLEEFRRESCAINCIICCASDCEDVEGLGFLSPPTGDDDSEDGGGGTGGPGMKYLFRRFCKKVLSLQRLELGRSLSLCLNCLENMGLVVHTKDEVDEIQGRVQSLQLKMLRELRELQSAMGVLEGQLRKIENCVKKSVVRFGDIERRKSEGLEVVRRVRRGQLQLNTCGEGTTDAALFRRKVIDVTNSLQLFRGDLSNKFPSGGAEGHNSTCSIPVLESLVKFKVETDDAVNLLLTHQEEDFDSPPSPSPPPPSSFQEEEDAQNPENDDGDNKPASLPSTSLPPRRSHRTTKGKRPIILTDSEGDEDKDDPAYLEEEGSHNHPPPPPTKRSLRRMSNSKSKRSTAENKRPNLSATNSEGEKDGLLVSTRSRPRSSGPKTIKKIMLSADDDDYVDADDYQHQPNTDDDEQSSSRRLHPNPISIVVDRPYLKYSRNPVLPQIDFGSMTAFKRFVVRNLLNKRVNVERIEDSRFPPNSAEYHLRQAEQERLSTQIEYDPQHDLLHLKQVKLLINEEDKSVDCSKCDYKYKVVQWPAKSDLEQKLFIKNGKRFIRNHLINHHHPTDFRCPLCPTADTTTSPSYKLDHYVNHLKSHLNLHPYTCSICQRPLTCATGLKWHLRTHMNEEERAQADMEGDQPGSVPYRYPCSTCGKLFESKGSLSKHEVIHVPKEERDLVLCPICGSSIRKPYYSTHLRKVCRPEGTPMDKCQECEKSFKTKASLQTHVKRTHSQDAVNRPHQCHICAGTFRIKWDLTNHMQIHSKEMIYQCGKGCGKKFARKRYWKTHEAGCKGPRK